MNEDRFARHLDDLVTGERSSAADDLAAFASQIQDAHGPGETGPLDTDQRNAIWRNLMAAHAHEVPTTGGPGPLSQPAMTVPDAYNPWTPKRPGPQKRSPRLGIVQPYLQTAITTFALLAIIIAGFAGYTAIRDNRAPEITPTAFAAAPTQSTELVASGNAESSPAPVTDWVLWVQPEECVAEPMSSEEYADIMNTTPDISGRSYDIVGPANADDSLQSAQVSQQLWLDACSIDQERSLQTDANIAYRSATETNAPSHEAREQTRIQGELDLTNQFSELQPADLFIILDEEAPADIQEQWEQPTANDAPVAIPVFDPATAVELDDGRIAVPSSWLVWADDPNIQWINETERAEPFVYILKNVDGEWLADEESPWMCVGDCSFYREQHDEFLRADPSGDSPAATPVTTPVD